VIELRFWSVSLVQLTSRPSPPHFSQSFQPEIAIDSSITAMPKKDVIVSWVHHDLIRSSHREEVRMDGGREEGRGDGGREGQQ